MRLLRVDEVLDDLDDQIGGQAVKVHLRGVLDPVALPVVVDLGVQRLVLVVDAVGEQLLQPLVLGERDVGPFVERVLALDAERRGVAAVVPRLSKMSARMPASLQLVGGAVPGHARPDHTEITHVSLHRFRCSSTTRWSAAAPTRDRTAASSRLVPQAGVVADHQRVVGPRRNAPRDELIPAGP